jgi:hypothetical protein
LNENEIKPSLDVLPLAISLPGSPSGVAGRDHPISTGVLSKGVDELIPVETLTLKVIQLSVQRTLTFASFRLKQLVRTNEMKIKCKALILAKIEQS